jgi:hypothetical protein
MALFLLKKAFVVESCGYNFQKNHKLFQPKKGPFLKD